MEIKGLGLSPLFLTLWCVVYLSTSFTLTIIHGPSPPLLFISHMGHFFAEQTFLGIEYAVMSTIALGLAFLNDKFVTLQLEAIGSRPPRIQKILLAIVWASWILTAVMGLLSRQYPMTHLVTSYVSCICAKLYNLCLAIFLYKVPGTTRVVCHARTTFCAMTLICAFLFVGCRVLVYTHLCDGGYEDICEALAKVIEWLMLDFILLTYVTYYPTMQSLLLTTSWNRCTISLRVKINDFGV